MDPKLFLSDPDPWIAVILKIADPDPDPTWPFWWLLPKISCQTGSKSITIIKCRVFFRIRIRAGIFKQSMGARNRIGIGCRTGPPGYIGWRNWFPGIDSKARLKFKNTASGPKTLSQTSPYFL